MSDSPRQLTEPDFEPPVVPYDYLSSSEDSAEQEARHHRLLEIAQDTENLEPHVIEALQALAMTIEEEEQDEEERIGPVVRDNIPNLDQPIFVRASDTLPEIMTPTAMLKATASEPQPPKLPRPRPPQPGPLDTPAFQQEFERIVEESLQPETEPPPPTDIPKTSLPPGLQEDLERIIEDNTEYKHTHAAHTD